MIEETAAPVPEEPKRGRRENLTNEGKGRPPGSLNTVTVQIREVCRAITFDRPEVVEFYAKKVLDGTIDPGTLKTLLEYGYGRVKHEVEVSAKASPVRALADALKSLSRADQARLYELDRKLLAAQEAEVVEVRAL